MKSTKLYIQISILFGLEKKKPKLKTERETERAVNNLKCSEVLREKTT